MRTGVALVMAAAMLAGCGKSAEEKPVSDAWVRLPAVPSRPAAAYFTLHGGATDTTLTRVSSSAAIRTEMHRSMTQGAVSAMHPLASAPVPAGETIKFSPGGNHLMLFDVDPSVVAGSTVPLTFDFSDGRHVDVQAKAIGAGDAEPK